MKKDLRVFLIDASTSLNRIEKFNIGDFFGPVELGFFLTKKYNSLNIGTGLFADSTLTGSNRLMFTGHSPCWDGFYVSAMGGAGLVFDRLDISMLSIIGKARNPSVLYLNHKGDGKIESRLEEIDVEKVWSEGEGGVYSLMDYVLDKYGNEYEKEPRILAVGESAKSTDFGAVCSAPVKKNIVTPVDTWAGRGGFGSKMYQDHNIVSVIYGGITKNRGFRDRKVIDKWFVDKYEMNFAQKDKQVSAKYSYVDVLKTGGTLGVNYYSLGGDLLSFNYSSIHKSENDRLSLNEKLITKHYLKQFNEETIQTKSHNHCGEPCATMCKKMNGKFKKDYEPYQAMGPLSAIFDQRAAEKLNRYADTYGFDAISVGGVISWLMEALWRGYVTPAEIGVKDIPKFETENFDVVETSMYNADIAVDILDSIVKKRGIVDLSDGARVFAHKLAKLKTKDILNLFSFNANGQKGWMVPNQYWTPGVLSPMALMGKYYMYYGADFVPPRELGVKNAQRFVAELMIDNIGVCRFHRGWAEEMTPQIIENLYGLKNKFLASINKIALKINDQGKPIFWESEKNIDIIHSFLNKKQSIKYAEELKEWVELFNKNKLLAAKSFWTEIYIGAQSYFDTLRVEENRVEFKRDPYDVG